MKAPNTEVVNDKCAVILCGKKKREQKYLRKINSSNYLTEQKPFIYTNVVWGKKNECLVFIRKSNNRSLPNCMRKILQKSTSETC